METIPKDMHLTRAVFDKIKNPDDARQTLELEMDILRMKIPSMSYIDNELPKLVVDAAIKSEAAHMYGKYDNGLIEALEAIAAYQDGKYVIRPWVNKNWGIRWSNQNIRRIPVVSPFRPNFDEEKLKTGDIKILRFKMFGDNNDPVPLPSCATTPIEPVVYHMDAEVTIAYDRAPAPGKPEILAFDLGYKFYCTYTTLSDSPCSQHVANFDTIKSSLYMNKITRNTSFLGMDDEINNVLSYLGKERFDNDGYEIGLSRCKHTMTRARRIEYAMNLITHRARNLANILKMDPVSDAKHEIFRSTAVADVIHFIFNRNDEISSIGDNEGCVTWDEFYSGYPRGSRSDEGDVNESDAEQD